MPYRYRSPDGTFAEPAHTPAPSKHRLADWTKADEQRIAAEGLDAAITYDGASGYLFDHKGKRLNYSHSAGSTADDCLRKYWYSRVAAIEAPKSRSLVIGTTMHDALEAYMRGRPEPFALRHVTDEHGARDASDVLALSVAQSGLHHLPPPLGGAPYAADHPDPIDTYFVEDWLDGGLYLEGEPSKGTRKAMRFKGKVDFGSLDGGLAAWHPAEAEAVVADHKSSSNLDYAKSANVLAHDQQIGSYAAALVFTHPSSPWRATGDDAPNPDYTKHPGAVGVSHVYYRTKGARLSMRVDALMPWANVEHAWAKAGDLAATMYDAALEPDANKVTHNPGACTRYGGCEFAPICPNSPRNQSKAGKGSKRLGLVFTMKPEGPDTMQTDNNAPTSLRAMMQRRTKPAPEATALAPHPESAEAAAGIVPPDAAPNAEATDAAIAEAVKGFGSVGTIAVLAATNAAKALGIDPTPLNLSRMAARLNNGKGGTITGLGALTAREAAPDVTTDPVPPVEVPKPAAAPPVEAGFVPPADLAETFGEHEAALGATAAKPGASRMILHYIAHVYGTAPAEAVLLAALYDAVLDGGDEGVKFTTATTAARLAHNAAGLSGVKQITRYTKAAFDRLVGRHPGVVCRDEFKDGRKGLVFLHADARAHAFDEAAAEPDFLETPEEEAERLTTPAPTPAPTTGPGADAALAYLAALPADRRDGADAAEGARCIAAIVGTCTAAEASPGRHLYGLLVHAAPCASALPGGIAAQHVRNLYRATFKADDLTDAVKGKALDAIEGASVVLVPPPWNDLSDSTQAAFDEAVADSYGRGFAKGAAARPAPTVERDVVRPTPTPASGLTVFVNCGPEPGTKHAPLVVPLDVLLNPYAREVEASEREDDGKARDHYTLFSYNRGAAYVAAHLRRAIEHDGALLHEGAPVEAVRVDSSHPCYAEVMPILRTLVAARGGMVIRR